MVMMLSLMIRIDLNHLVFYAYIYMSLAIVKLNVIGYCEAVRATIVVLYSPRRQVDMIPSYRMLSYKATTTVSLAKVIKCGHF